MKTLSFRITKAVTDGQWQPIHLVKGGQKFSHMFFADDLLLYGETTYAQARVMDYVLKQFCWDSGQLASTSKWRAWFAPATPIYLKGSICSAFGDQSDYGFREIFGSAINSWESYEIHFSIPVDQNEKMAVHLETD